MASLEQAFDKWNETCYFRIVGENRSSNGETL